MALEQRIGSAINRAGRIDGSGGDTAEQVDVEFDRGLEEEFIEALDLNNWSSGPRMNELSERLEREVSTAIRDEATAGPRILDTLQRSLAAATDRTPEAGIYSLSPDNVSAALRNVVFNGNLEACDGTRVTVNTLPISIVQIGICATSYVGKGGGETIGHRLFRRDVLRHTGDPAEDILAFLEQRSKRRSPKTEYGDDGVQMSLSDMMCRALMVYGERALLADRSTAPWRLGHGGPMPHELIVGSGRKDLAEASLTMLRRLLLGHKKFIFVPTMISDPVAYTIANALRPLQYAVLKDTRDIVRGYWQGTSYERPHYQKSGLLQKVKDFGEDVGSKVLLCVYRASQLSPGHVFFAHEDHVHEAAQIVMADSVLQEARGFPNLIDIADRTCRGMFEPGALGAQVHAAMAKTGAPFRFLPERDTRI
jgi:hypothetical protein